MLGCWWSPFRFHIFLKEFVLNKHHTASSVLSKRSSRWGASASMAVGVATFSLLLSACSQMPGSGGGGASSAPPAGGAMEAPKPMDAASAPK